VKFVISSFKLNPNPKSKPLSGFQNFATEYMKSTPTNDCENIQSDDITSKVAYLLAKPKQPQYSESWTNNPSNSRNGHLAINRVHCTGNITNSVLYVAQTGYSFSVLRKQKLKQFFRHYQIYIYRVPLSKYHMNEKTSFGKITMCIKMLHKILSIQCSIPSRHSRPLNSISGLQLLLIFN